MELRRRKEEEQLTQAQQQQMMQAMMLQMMQAQKAAQQSNETAPKSPSDDDPSKIKQYTGCFHERNAGAARIGRRLHCFFMTTKAVMKAGKIFAKQ